MDNLQVDNPKIETNANKAKQPQVDLLSKKPKRGFSSYNLYFQLERERLVSGAPTQKYTIEDVARIAKISHAKAQQKRKHRKSHGKISFTDLARIIANSWKKLPYEDKTVFEDYAKVEKAEYQERFKQWKHACFQRQLLMYDAVGEDVGISETSSMTTTTATDLSTQSSSTYVVNGLPQVNIGDAATEGYDCDDTTSEDLLMLERQFGCLTQWKCCTEKETKPDQKFDVSSTQPSSNQSSSPRSDDEHGSEQSRSQSPSSSNSIAYSDDATKESYYYMVPMLEGHFAENAECDDPFEPRPLATDFANNQSSYHTEDV